MSEPTVSGGGSSGFDETMPMAETAATTPARQDLARTRISDRQPAARPEIPEVTIERELGRGGMGVVFAGRQTYLDRAVAIKVLKPEVGGEEYVARFRREATLLAGLHHPHIVACYQAGATPAGECYLVMEFIDGPNLWQQVKANGPLTPSAVLRVIADIASALGYAQAKGIIHRDVKAENILLAPGGGDADFPFTAKLVDLGLAKPVQAVGDAALTRQGMLLGTPSTMAPEQFDDPERVDHRADMYGLGCAAFQALTGAPAFRGTSLMELVSAKASGVIPDPTALRSDCPAPVAALVQRLLARRPDDRFATYADLGEACRLAGAGPLVPPARRRRPLLAVAMAVVVLGGGATAWVWGRSREVAQTPSTAVIPGIIPPPSHPAPVPATSPPLDDIVWGQRRSLYRADLVKALDDWRRAPGWGPDAELGSGIIGSSSARSRIERTLAGGVFRCSGSFGPAGEASYHEAAILVLAADGPALRLAIRNTGALHFLVVETTSPIGEPLEQLTFTTESSAPPWRFALEVSDTQARCRLNDGEAVASDLRAPAVGIGLEVVEGAVLFDPLDVQDPRP